MLKNYIKIAWRNLTKHKIYSAITMSGLVLGLGIFIVFALLLHSQSKYDSFHEKGDFLDRLTAKAIEITFVTEAAR